MNAKTLPEVLRQRDVLENAWVRKVPGSLRPYASELLTRITGVAPSTTGGKPLWAGSETRSVVYHLLMLAIAPPMLLLGSPGMAAVGAILWIAFARGFTSGFGHHLTHSASRLPWPKRYTVLAYDIIGAAGWFAVYAEYRSEHGKHHAWVATPQDPDRQFLEWVGARLTSWRGYLTTLLHPRVHGLFLLARLRSVFTHGPLWRRALAAVWLLVMGLQGAQPFLTWLVVAGLGLQIAAITSWLSLHIWEARTEGLPTSEAATTVTFARLMIPQPTLEGLILHLPVYALAKVLFIQSDLPQHVLHHIGLGPWTEAPYVLTNALLNGRHIQATTTLRAMFELPMMTGGKKNAPPPDADAWMNM